VIVVNPGATTTRTHFLCLRGIGKSDSNIEKRAGIVKEGYETRADFGAEVFAIQRAQGGTTLPAPDV
jgi:hypothetical protein